MFLEECNSAVSSPVYDPEKNTVLRSVYQAVSMKQRHHMTNEAMDELCEQKVRDGYGKVSFPQNWHTVRAALEVSTVEEQEYHVCHLCGRVWDWCARNKYGEHKDDRCKFDGTSRFVRGGMGQLVPRRKVWLRRLEDVIQSFLREPKIAQRLGEQRQDARDESQDRHDAPRGTSTPVKSFWESPYLRWLDNICKRCITRPRDNEMAMLFALGTVLLSVRATVRLVLAYPAISCENMCVYWAVARRASDSSIGVLRVEGH